MTFTEFLAALMQALEETAGSPPVEPIPRVRYGSGCREATAPPDQILIGVGPGGWAITRSSTKEFV